MNGTILSETAIAGFRKRLEGEEKSAAKLPKTGENRHKKASRSALFEKENAKSFENLHILAKSYIFRQNILDILCEHCYTVYIKWQVDIRCVALYDTISIMP